MGLSLNIRDDSCRIPGEGFSLDSVVSECPSPPSSRPFQSCFMCERLGGRSCSECRIRKDKCVFFPGLQPLLRPSTAEKVFLIASGRPFLEFPQIVMVFQLVLLLIVFPAITAKATMPLPVTTTAKKFCFMCTIYAFIGGETRCANPGKCESDECYTYVSSTGVPLMLDGCVQPSASAPPNTNFSLTVSFSFEQPAVPFCHSFGSVALCFCKADSLPSFSTPETPAPLLPLVNISVTGLSFCNRYFNESGLVGHLIKSYDFEELALETTGVSGDYVRKRLSQMNLGDLPDVFQGKIINGSTMKFALSHTFAICLSMWLIILM